MSGRPRLLIEEWFPIREVGVECQRERSVSSSLPPLYYLHVYWARRPLAVSRAALLASLLPPETDQKRFLRWIGIHGDAVAARQRILAAQETGEKVEGGYGYPRAFTYTPTAEEREEFQALMERLWGTRTPQVLDPMAGGGSILFEAVRLGLPAIGNDLNPLAHIIQRATVEYPTQFGPALAEKIQYYAKLVEERARAVLEPCFPVEEGEDIHAYVWARTVTCPHCAATIPLSPNWWLERDTAGNGWASMPVLRGNEVSFEVVQIIRGRGPGGFDPASGSIKRGTPLCPVCRQTVPGDEVKRQAQIQGMGQQLVAVVVKRNGVRGFRTPTEKDLDGVRQAASLLESKLPAWEAAGLVPDEVRYVGPADRSANYGMRRACDLFSPRQLLGHITYLEGIKKVLEEAARELSADEHRAVGTYLAFMLDKAVDYNSSMARWNPPRGGITNTFDRHDFSIKWSFAEFDAARQLWSWVSHQVLDAYRRIAELTYHTSGRFYAIFKSATHLPDLGSGSVTAICIDPPYYDNVMYAELADFFYVWQKRSLGDLFPEVFASRLTNKDDEAVANPARFKGMGRSAKKLAEEDYEKKMQAVFAEAHRVLRDDGAMTVMFTHKRTEAWDTLAAALMNAGFVVTASWPVRTEFEHSLHIARKNAAESTILLVCRKRPAGAQGGWWEEIQPLIGRAVRARLPQFEEAGITGVDLYLAAFGPALQLLGEAWPVRDATGNLIRPEVALAEARKAVTEHRLAALAHHQALGLDPVTRFTILAWDAFKAVQFPFDEARRLSIASGVSVDLLRSHGLAERKGKYLNLLTPEERVRSGKLKLRTRDYPYLIDAIHTAMAIYAEDGAPTASRFLEEVGLARSPDFIRAIEAFLKALPPFRPEYATLLRMAATVLEGQIDLTGMPAPVTPAPEDVEEAEEEEGEE